MLFIYPYLYPVQHLLTYLLTLGVSRSFVQDELSFLVLRKSLFENLLYILTIFEAIWKEDINTSPMFLIIPWLAFTGQLLQHQEMTNNTVD